MCGMKIVSVGTDAKGNINIEELRKAAEANKDNLAALMVSIGRTEAFKCMSFHVLAIFYLTYLLFLCLLGYISFNSWSLRGRN